MDDGAGCFGHKNITLSLNSNRRENSQLKTRKTKDPKEEEKERVKGKRRESYWFQRHDKTEYSRI